MAYLLNALVSTLIELPSHPELRPVPLTLDWKLIPLPDSFWCGALVSHPLLRSWEARQAPDADFENSADRTSTIRRAERALAHISAVCKDLSRQAPVAYLEAEFFGGVGRQAAAAWSAGVVTFEPTVAEGAINLALAQIGVTRGPADEFATLGLQRHRFTDDWIPAFETDD